MFASILIQTLSQNWYQKSIQTQMFVSLIHEYTPLNFNLNDQTSDMPNILCLWAHFNHSKAMNFNQTTLTQT